MKGKKGWEKAKTLLKENAGKIVEICNQNELKGIVSPFKW